MFVSGGVWKHGSSWSGNTWQERSSWQWQPDLDSHDPNPPIPLENPSGDVTGTGAGTVVITGSGTGAHGVSGTGAGTVAPSASATAAHGVSGAAAGSVTLSASAAGAHGVSGVGAGSISITGSGTGTFQSSQAAAVGRHYGHRRWRDEPDELEQEEERRPEPVYGTGAGFVTITASGRGAHGVAGTGAGTVAGITGSAEGRIIAVEELAAYVRRRMEDEFLILL